MIELIIVIGITALLTSLVLLYGSSSRAQIALNVEKVKIVQVLSKAKALAISAYAGQNASCGYGVRFSDPSHYEIFRYNPASCSNIAALDLASGGAYAPVPTAVYTLHPSLIFDPGPPNPLPGSERLDAVLFVPPDPKTLLWNGGSQLGMGTVQLNSGTVYLKTKDGSASASVTVSAGGQITY